MIIGEGSHPENVKVYGPGVEKTGLKANEPTYFTVDCSEAGQGEAWSKSHTVHVLSPASPLAFNMCGTLCCLAALSANLIQGTQIFQEITITLIDPRCVEENV